MSSPLCFVRIIRASHPPVLDSLGKMPSLRSQRVSLLVFCHPKLFVMRRVWFVFRCAAYGFSTATRPRGGSQAVVQQTSRASTRSAAQLASVWSCVVMHCTHAHSSSFHACKSLLRPRCTACFGLYRCASSAALPPPTYGSVFTNSSVCNVLYFVPSQFFISKDS